MTPSPLPHWPARFLLAVLGHTAAAASILGDLREEYAPHAPGIRRTLAYSLACVSVAFRYLPPLLLDVMRVELRHAVRSLAHARTYVVAAVLTLSVGVGIVATLLTITYGSLLRPLPYPRPHELIGLGQSPLTGQGAGSINSIAVANLRDLSSGLQQLSGVAGFVYRRVTLTTPAGAQQALTASVTGNFFDVLEARPLLGRTFTFADDVAGSAPTVILAETLWRREFHARPDIVGQMIRLDTQPHLVIGVMPAHLPWPGSPQAWVPMQWTVEQAAVRNRRAIEAIGRMTTGATLAGASDELRARFARLAEAHPAENGKSTIATRPLVDIMIGSIGPHQTLLPLLAGLAGAMLLVAYLNLGTLATGRREARQHESALRHVLGAAGWRRHLSRWTEAGLICVAGAAGGTLLTAWTIPVVLSRYGRTIARADTIGLDASTAVIIALAAFGGALVLAAGARETAPLSVSHLNRRTATRSGAVRRRLVAVQIGLAGGLVYGAVLIGGMVASLARVDLGVPLGQALTFGVGIPPARYDSPERVRNFFLQLEDTMRTMPSITGAGGTSRVPFAGGTNGEVGNAHDPAVPPVLAEWRAITPGFVSAIGLPLIAGQDFSSRPPDGSRPVLVSEDLSVALFGTARGVGRSVRIGSTSPYVVSGIVGNIRDFGPARAGRPTIYFLHGSEAGFQSTTDMTVVVRGPAQASMIRQRIAGIDPDIAIRSVESLDTLATRSLGSDRTTARTVLVVFAALALLLGMVGVFGVAAVNVEQRTREIGIRLAIGDTPSGILRRIMHDGLRVAALGLTLGVAVAWWVHHLVRAFLVSDHQPNSFFVAGLVLAALLTATTVASFIPARRAARLSPVDALRAG